MLEKFGLAPMSGEIVGGGLSFLFSRCPPCFGRLGGSNYGLNTIIRYATQVSIPRFAQDVSMLNWRLDSLIKEQHYSNINEILVLLSRVKQFGGYDETLHSKVLIALKQLQCYIQYCYFLLLLGKHLDIDDANLKNLLNNSNAEDFREFLKIHFNYSLLLDKLNDLNFNLKDAYDRPSLELMSPIINIFQSPSSLCPLVIKEQDSESNLILMAIIHQSRSFCSRWYFQDAIAFDELLGNYHEAANLKDSFLSQFYRDPPQKPENILEEERCLLEYIDELQVKKNILQNLLKKTPEESKFSQQQLALVQNPFPMVLTTESIAMEPVKYEYRATRPLKFSQDIKVIATDNGQHRLFLMKYFDYHKLINIKVLLIEDLIKSEETQQEPYSPFVHKNSFPRLTWLAAKAVPLDVELPQNKACHPVSNLLAEAKEYHRVQMKV